MASFGRSVSLREPLLSPLSGAENNEEVPRPLNKQALQDNPSPSNSAETTNASSNLNNPSPSNRAGSARADSGIARNICCSWYIIVIGIIVRLICLGILILAISGDSISVNGSIDFGDSKHVSTLRNRLVLSDALTLSDFSSDSRYLAYTTSDSNVLVYGLTKYDILAKFSYNKTSASDTIVNIRFVLDDKYVVGCTWEGILRMWSLEKKSEVLKYNVPSYLSSFKITKDRKNAIAYGGYSIYDLNLETQQMSQRIGPPPSSGTIIDMNISVDNEFYAAITEKRFLHVWFLETKYEVAKFVLSEPYSTIYFTDDSKYLVAHGEQSITVWQTSNWSKVAYIPYKAKIYSTSSTSDSKYIVLATAAGADILRSRQVRRLHTYLIMM